MQKKKTEKEKKNSETFLKEDRDSLFYSCQQNEVAKLTIYMYVYHFSQKKKKKKKKKKKRKISFAKNTDCN